MRHSACPCITGWISPVTGPDTISLSLSHCENVAYTMKGLLYFSDGTDYVTKVEEKLGLEASGRQDQQKI